MGQAKGQRGNKSIATRTGGLPKGPGVYLFKDRAGQVIYVGKASNLHSRVSSYFHRGVTDLKTAALVASICDLDHIETDSEVEALLLESRLIKDYRPKYNSDLKDDKSYPLIAISREPFPSVSITRNRGRDSQYIGPFVAAKELKGALPLLQRIFKFRTCSRHISPEKTRGRRPCLLYHIERCSAPCAGRVSLTSYRRQIQNFKKFLKRGKKELLSQLKQQMRRAAESLDFEQAAWLRDQITALEQVHRLAQLVGAGEGPVHADAKRLARASQGTQAPAGAAAH